MKQLDIVVCGGTFDHLHKGHEAFLTYTLSVGKKVLIGLTTDEYAKQKMLNDSIEPFMKRKDSLLSFLGKHKAIHRVEIVPIDNVFIPDSLNTKKIDTIVVSEETKKGAEIINIERQKQNLPPLRVLVMPLVRSGNEVISSNAIRSGKTNRYGRSYINPVWKNSVLLLTQELRTKLQKPFGLLIRDFDHWAKVNHISSKTLVTVGDIITKSFNTLSLKPKIAIVDFVVERRKTYSNILELGFNGNEKVMQAVNPASHLTPDLFHVVKNSFADIKKPGSFVIQVIGEEDLSVLPVLLVAPLGFSIFYGQPNKGVVKVEVNEENKEKAYQIVESFKPA